MGLRVLDNPTYHRSSGSPWWVLGTVDTGSTSDAPCFPSSALGKPMYLHIGEEIDGVDMRAEVGLLSRNIVVMGEMEDECYPYSNHLCNFFDFDTFGGHIKVRQIYLAEPVNPARRIRTTPSWGQGCLAGKGLGGKG